MRELSSAWIFPGRRFGRVVCPLLPACHPFSYLSCPLWSHPPESRELVRKASLFPWGFAGVVTSVSGEAASAAEPQDGYCCYRIRRHFPVHDENTSKAIRQRCQRRR